MPHHAGAPPDRRPPRAALAGGPPLGPEQCQSRQGGAECPAHLLGPITLLAPRRRPADDAEQPAASDDDGARAPAVARAALLAPAPPVSGGCPV